MTQTGFAFCHADSLSDRLGHLALAQVILSDSGSPPEWIMLVPAGDKIEALDGRKFSNADPQAVVDAFNADPRDVPIDWEHATELKSPKGEEAPAAGWITAMEVRSGAIWGKVDWTDRGAESIVGKLYRYISPAFAHSKAKNLVKKIVSAALVNRPALDMPAVARNQVEDAMDPRILKMLGLEENATPEQVIEAMTKLQAGPAAELETVKTELEAAQAKLATTETELANARNANPELDKFVPRADYDAVMARAKTAEDTIKTNKLAEHTKSVEAEIAAAMKAGKVTPASKEFYVATCSTPEGLEKFREFVKTAPTIGDPSDLDDGQPPAGDGSGVTNKEELEVAKAFGMTPEEYTKARAEAVAAAQ
jgi:phage I-like protein